MTTIDRAIDRAPMPRHSDEREVAKLLRRVATGLEGGNRAEEMASLLAAEGWSSGTTGDGGSRGTEDVSSVERSMGLAGPSKTPTRGLLDRWKGVDRRRHQLIRDLKRLASDLEHLDGQLLAHTSDHDRVPAGTGECAACGRFCRPTKARPGFRLRSTLCPSCYGAWRDARMPEPRSDWIRARRERLTDDAGVVHPEDDSAIDMTTELPPAVGS